jgi:uncharacterized protein
MADIGRKGGEAVSEDREHMAEIGRKGGESRGGEGGESDDDEQTVGTRGGSSEQHSRAGRQSHKNDDK